jgi:hypothetical protein
VARSWRERLSRLWHSKTLHYAKRVAPFLVSVGLVAWLVWSITPQKLGRAFSGTAWPWLVLASAVQVVVLFVWDTLCLWWLFSQPDRRLPFLTVLRARTDTAVWSAVNLEIGQAAFAVELARHKDVDVPVLMTLGRCMALALFDFGTLQSLALIGSFLVDNPIIQKLRWLPVGSVSGLIILAVLLRFMPQRWRDWLEEKNWASWLKWWRWRHSIILYSLRMVMFLLVLVYAGVCLAICRVPVSARLVVGVIPFVLIAEALPGTGGLGERETALVYLLGAADHDRAVLLSFGLIWSFVIILGRLAIGLSSRLLPRRKEEASDEKQADHAGQPSPSAA